MSHIRDRYALSGPHATSIVRLPVPGAVGDDLDVRWSATEAELHRCGASDRMVANMRDLLDATNRRGQSLLITATDEDAACCWLSGDRDSSIDVGALPALLPAVHQAGLAPASAIGASIDRTGADVYRIGAFDIEIVTTVQGDHEFVHKAASGGWSQARNQRHSEVVWERNASLIAAAIIDENAVAAAHGIVLTGDEREVRLVETELLDRQAGRVARRAVGGRHEPGTTDRLRAAVMEFRTDWKRRQVARALEDLREELGQQDRAVSGSVAVTEALADHRVKTLFVDLGTSMPHVDAMIRSALAQGASVLTSDDRRIDHGVAAMLRVPYR